VFYITHAGMSPKIVEIELFAPANYVIGTVTTNTDMRGTDSAATAANLATVDTVVDAIKVKTDSLTFTVANKVDANTKSINDVIVTGTGVSTNLWRA